MFCALMSTLIDSFRKFALSAFLPWILLLRLLRLLATKPALGSKIVMSKQCAYVEGDEQSSQARRAAAERRGRGGGAGRGGAGNAVRRGAGRSKKGFTS